MKLENGMSDSGGCGLDVIVRMPDSFPLEAAQVWPEDVICGPDVLLRKGTVTEMGDGNATHMMACSMHDDVLKAPCSLSTFVGTASVVISLVPYSCDEQPARVVGGGIHGVFPFVESFPRWDEPVLSLVGPVEYDCNRNMSKSKGWTHQSSLLKLWMEKTRVNNQTKIDDDVNLLKTL